MTNNSSIISPHCTVLPLTLPPHLSYNMQYTSCHLYHRAIIIVLSDHDLLSCRPGAAPIWPQKHDGAWLVKTCTRNITWKARMIKNRNICHLHKVNDSWYLLGGTFKVLLDCIKQQVQIKSLLRSMLYWLYNPCTQISISGTFTRCIIMIYKISWDIPSRAC